MTIPTRDELIERLYDCAWEDKVLLGTAADFALAEIRRAVAEELEALRGGVPSTPLGGPFGLGAWSERNCWMLSIDARLAALRAEQTEKPGAESQAPNMQASERAEGRAASSPCPPPAFVPLDELQSLAREYVHHDGPLQDALARFVARVIYEERNPDPGDAARRAEQARATNVAAPALSDAELRCALRELERCDESHTMTVTRRINEINAELERREHDKPGATSHPAIEAECTQPANESGVSRSAGADKGSKPVTAAMASATSPVCPGRSTTDPAPALSESSALSKVAAGSRAPGRVENAQEELPDQGSSTAPALSDADVLERAADVMERHDLAGLLWRNDLTRWAAKLRAASAPEPVETASDRLRAALNENRERYMELPQWARDAIGVPFGSSAPQPVDVFEAIKAERAAQDAKWGGPEHDDTHGIADWSRYIKKHVGRLDVVERPENQEAVLVRVAALAVAAIESLRRRHAPEQAKEAADAT